MQTYEQTHPWLTFTLDLRQADYRLWMLLGEAQSKCQQIAGTPLLPDLADHLHQVYLAKGVLATTAIEGNTLTEEEVLRRIQGRLDLPPSKEYLGQEIDNIVAACNLIGTSIFQGGSTRLTVEDVKSYNRLVLHGLTLDEGVVPGAIRSHRVAVGRYLAAPPGECAYLLERLVDWLNDGLPAPAENYRTAFGILRALVAHIYLAWIHPFGDGNGRTARLVEFQILLANGVPSAAAQLLSNHYNQTRTEYYRQLDQASKSGGDLLPFLRYALQGFVDGLVEQLEVIRGQQLTVHWVNYVHELFKDQESPTEVRRRRLVLDMSRESAPIPLAQVRHVSPRIAEAYAGKTDKTVQRDVNALVNLGLVERMPRGVRVRRETVLAFLPGVRR